MKKIIKRAIAFVLSTVMLLGLCACQQNGDVSGEQVLEVYIWDAGYGTSWLSASLEAFSELDWVKEKYPNLKTKLVSNDQSGYASGRITAGDANTIDLFFASDLDGTYSHCLNLADVLFGSEVPGENVLYKDKMHSYWLESCEQTDSVGKPTGEYYHTLSQVGLVSYIYNQTLFDELGLTVPRTTEEMVELCQTVKDMGGTNPAYPYTHSIISSKIAYSDRLTEVWWAQYDALQGYRNYWNAIAPDGTRNSVDIFEEQGRLEAIKVFESLYREEQGYYDRTSTNYEFIQGQTRLLIGEGLMMACGEWFSTEMRDLAVEYQKRGYDYDIRMMRLPVVSSIIDKTPTITDETMLRQVISDIDAGQTEPSNSLVSAEDFATVRAARGVFSARDASNAHAVIPSYAEGKDVAVDFLRFMATDEACAIVAEETYGGVSAFEFDLQTAAPDVHQMLEAEYGQTYAVLLDVADFLNTDFAQAVTNGSSPLVQYGGFTAWDTKYDQLELIFMSNPNITAEQIVEEHDSYWLDNNAKAFQDALSRAGLS